MQKAIISLFVFIIIIFFSCEPPEMCWKKELIAQHSGPHGWGWEEYICPKQGTDCALKPCPSQGTANRSLLDSFYAAYDRGQAATYFATYQWYNLFPELLHYKGMADSIIAGKYGVVVDANGSIGITPSGSNTNKADAIFVFKMETPCDTHNY